MKRDKQRRAAKSAAKHRTGPTHRAHPAADTLTVVWMTTLATAVVCLLGAVAARLYFVFLNPQAPLIRMLSAYLLLTSAVIGLILLFMTPIVLKRKRSNPPWYVTATAYVVGALPWLLMLLQASE